MTSAGLGRKRRNGRAAFTKVEHEVRTGLLGGKTLISIYEGLVGRLDLSYSQFRRYARALRSPRARPPATRVPGTGASQQLPSGGSRRPDASGTPGTSGSRDAIPKVDMDSFAAKALEKKDLI